MRETIKAIIEDLRYEWNDHESMLRPGVMFLGAFVAGIFTGVWFS